MAEPEFTPRGFRIWGRVADDRGTVLTVQESSAADDMYTWLFFVEPGYENGQPHLTLDQIAELHQILGQLLAEHEGGSAREEWSVRDGDGSHKRAVAVSEQHARLLARFGGSVERRVTYTGNWQEVSDGQ